MGYYYQFISMTIQQQLAERIYELLPHKKHILYGIKILVVSQDKIGTTSGEKIRLSDIMVCLDEFATSDFCGMLISTGGIIQVRNRSHVFRIVKPTYNLKQDDVLKQSDEFCEFIYNLIK